MYTKLKFVAICGIGLLIVFYINSPKTNSTVHVILSNDQSVEQDTRQEIGFANAPLRSFSKILIDEDALQKSIAEETNKELTMAEMTSAMIITKRPFSPLFQCDFNSSCFENNPFTLTNGTEFNPVLSPDGLEPPEAPTSDATSITTPTSNNETCDLPYILSLSNIMYTAYWFCYNNTCKTKSENTAICVSGLYGLVSLNSSETSKTVISSIVNNSILRDSVGVQCLRFYYYFTIYNGQNWQQRIEVLIRPDNDIVRQISLANLTILNWQRNGWQFQDITFNSTFSNYTLVFDFNVGIDRTANSTVNRTIHFALDNIELDDFNCTYVNDQLNATAAPDVVTSSLGLIIGLSLGLGIPVLIGIIIGIYYLTKEVDDENSRHFDIPMR